MRRSAILSLVLPAVSSLFLVVVSCAPESPAERIAGIRGQYSARLNGFIVEEEPTVTPVVEASEEGAEVGSDTAAAEPDPATDEFTPEVVTVEQKIRLDILIQHRSSENLPGITVDISMVDANENDKGHWRVWFDTANVAKATVTQFTHILEDVGYEEGDGFFVEVRHPVPEADRGDYREFADAL